MFRLFFCVLAISASNSSIFRNNSDMAKYLDYKSEIVVSFMFIFVYNLIYENFDPDSILLFLVMPGPGLGLLLSMLVSRVSTW